MDIKVALVTAGLAMVAFATSGASFAATETQIDGQVSETLVKFVTLNPSHKELIDKAAGVLVFPGVTKGGAGVAGEHGQGALQVNGKTVGYYSVGAASVGLTLGVAKRSEIIVFMTQESLDKFTSGKDWAIGADAGITVISGGAAGSYDTQTMHKPILGFMFSEKGLIGDLSFEGSKISKINPKV
jgi:lipid-binding SYLF domain-containing protein